MKTLRCSDLGTQCSFVTTGKTSAEVKKHMMEHAKKVHPEVFKNATPADMKRMGQLMNKKMKIRH